MPAPTFARGSRLAVPRLGWLAARRRAPRPRSARIGLDAGRRQRCVRPRRRPRPVLGPDRAAADTDADLLANGDLRYRRGEAAWVEARSSTVGPSGRRRARRDLAVRCRRPLPPPGRRQPDRPGVPGLRQGAGRRRRALSLPHAAAGAPMPLFARRTSTSGPPWRAHAADDAALCRGRSGQRARPAVAQPARSPADRAALNLAVRLFGPARTG